MKRQPAIVSALGGVVLLALAPAFSVASTSQPAPPIPFDRAEIKIELNATDEDAGIQLLLDGEGWERAKIFNPDGGKVMDIEARRSVGHIGVTELFFESAEPSLEDLPLEDLLAMFPEGEYTIDGRTVAGERLSGSATLTHNIPAGPTIVSPEPGEVVDPTNAVVAWAPVTDPPGIEIIGYQVIVEREDPLRIVGVDLPATATSVTIPVEFLEPGTDYKFEVLAIEIGGNQTISEADFVTAD